MSNFYAVKQSALDNKEYMILSMAVCDQICLDAFNYAKDNNYVWLTEEEAVAAKVYVRDMLGHQKQLTPAKTWEVTVKLEDGCIWAYWMDKWRGIREYRVKGKTPSADVMKLVEHTFRLNSGIPKNHHIKFIW